MLKVAVDFDGTVVENKFPDIGKPMLFAFETLKAMQQKGMLLILWTVRNGKELDEAIEFCRANGVEFYAVNANYPEEQFDAEVSRKIEADVFIDDRNIGGFVGWSNVWQDFFPEDKNRIKEQKVISGLKRKPFWKRVFNK
ncbi:MAG TPA: hydrolase [Bacteroidales bacterium]|jgi:hydroxymethylpyrimidine pyrophosphatase-like HAD family hydrolase|nr:hydrolase [Bacteroidales bacterium]